MKPKLQDDHLSVPVMHLPSRGTEADPQALVRYAR